MERTEPPPGRSVRVVERTVPRFEFELHKHAEYELTVVTSSSGRRFVGDHVDTYGPGDLVLLGPMLPHTWVSETPGRAAAVVVHFGRELIGDWPEAVGITALLDAAVTGLGFHGPGTRAVADLVEGLVDASPVQRIVKLVDALDRLSSPSSPDRRRLARPEDLGRHDTLDGRLEQVLLHVAQHFREGVSQRECAELVGLSPSALCRLFRRSMHRTFTEYVNELRTNEACRLLATGEDPVTSIAFEAGFENLSYFNRVFRRTRGMSPTAYRHRWVRDGSQGTSVGAVPA